MKKILFVILIFTGYFLHAQQADNPFYETEKAVEKPKDIPESGENETDRLPGNPPKPVPIDDYIPVLISIAVGMIIYKTYQKKKLLS